MEQVVPKIDVLFRLASAEFIRRDIEDELISQIGPIMLLYSPS